MATVRAAREDTQFQRRILIKLRQTPKTQITIGLDVHKNSIHAAIFRDGGILADWRAPAHYAAFANQLLPLLPFTKTVAYEAGPTGFSLARVLQRQGFSVIVCAPTHTPRASARQDKSDKIDAAKLARFAAHGMLAAVTIPTEQEEQDRLVLRHRNALVDKLRRAKQQIKAGFLFTGSGEVASWGKAEAGRLAAMPCPGGQRFALDSLLREMALLEDEVRKTGARIERVMGERHAKAKAILESHPGVGPVTAATFALELFRPKRFRNGRAVARFLGLAPGKSQSGETDRPAPLLKTGQSRLRAQLVEAAWRWIRIDPAARAVYGRIASRKRGNAKKAIAAMARRLAVRLWTMWTRGEMYDAERAKSRPAQARPQAPDRKRGMAAEAAPPVDLGASAGKAVREPRRAGAAPAAKPARPARTAKAPAT